MPKKILIIDDNLELQGLVKAQLEKSGYSVTTAGDGSDCIPMILADRPDLLVLDINMPKLDGVSTLERMVEQDLLRDLPVIMLTSEADKEIVQKALKLGIADYLVKPFDLKELLARVSRQLVEVSFLDVEQLLDIIRAAEHAPKRAEHPLKFTRGAWNAHLLRHRDREMCLLLPKSLGPNEAQKLDESAASEVIRVYTRRGQHWVCLWPATSQRKAA